MKWTICNKCDRVLVKRQGSEECVCGEIVDIWFAESPPKILMDNLCKACRGKGISSKGWPCVPCDGKGFKGGNTPKIQT